MLLCYHYNASFYKNIEISGTKYRKTGKAMDLIEHIENYIVYLITECELSLTVHPMEK